MPAAAVARAAVARAAGLAPVMRSICGAGNVLTDPLELRTYECDGLTSHRATPALVVLPSTAEEVAAVVRACASAGVIFVARGSGTGLSGGAVPHAEGVLIVMSRMRRVLEIDAVARRAVVEPGVTNLSVTEAVRPFGLFYAPDPSSQVVCSVGGNVAENSGGAHCLKHGFTVNHVLGLEIVTPAGELTWLGDGTGVGLVTTCWARSPGRRARSASSPRSSSSSPRPPRRSTWCWPRTTRSRRAAGR